MSDSTGLFSQLYFLSSENYLSSSWGKCWKWYISGWWQGWLSGALRELRRNCLFVPVSKKQPYCWKHLWHPASFSLTGLLGRRFLVISGETLLCLLPSKIGNTYELMPKYVKCSRVFWVFFQQIWSTFRLVSEIKWEESRLCFHPVVVSVWQNSYSPMQKTSFFFPTA